MIIDQIFSLSNFECLQLFCFSFQQLQGQFRSADWPLQRMFRFLLLQPPFLPHVRALHYGRIWQANSFQTLSNLIVACLLSLNLLSPSDGQMITEETGVRSTPPKYVDVSNLHSENVRNLVAVCLRFAFRRKETNFFLYPIIESSLCVVHFPASQSSVHAGSAHEFARMRQSASVFGPFRAA